jgi:HEAT repeat protein
MKNKSVGLSLLTYLIGLAVLPAFSGQLPTQAELDATLSAAAVYESGQNLEAFRRIEEWVRQSGSEPRLRSQLEAGLIKLLDSSSTFEARRFACKELGIIGTENALPALSGLLQDETTAGMACLALTTYPPGRADEELRTALSSAGGTARIQIINTLGDRRVAKSVETLSRFASDNEPAAAEAAIAALGKIGSRSAWKVIETSRPRAALGLAPLWTEAMLRCGEKIAASGHQKMIITAFEGLLTESEPAYIRRAALQTLIQTDKDQGEERIVKVLHGLDPVLKPVAIAAVRSLRAAGATQKFAGETPNLAPDEQVWMIDSLAARAGPDACSAITGCLTSSHPIVQQAAISALGRIGDASTVGVLAHALANSQEPERRRAIESALVSLGGGTETDKRLTVELKGSTGAARVHLLTALAKREGEAANPLLLREIDSTDAATAKAAFHALGQSATERELPVLLNKFSNLGSADVRSEAEGAAREALGSIEDESRRSTIVRDALRQVAGVESRTSLLSLLPVCADSAALDTVKAATTDPDSRVRDTAIRTLADWPNGSARDALVALSQQPQSETLRGVVFAGLVRLTGEENEHADAGLVDRYRQLLSSAHGEAETKLVLGALGGANTPEALQLVIPLLSEPGVHAEAAAAVKRIAQSIKTKHPEAAAEALQKLEAKK